MTYPYIEAKWKTVLTSRRPTLIVLHAPETPERPDSAESVARYFQHVVRKASTHLVSDNNSTVRCVLDKDVAYGAAGANRCGLHVEICGYTNQTAAQWIDAYSLAAMDEAAKAVALWCHEYNIPIRFLTATDLRAGTLSGITTHAEVEKAFPSTGHTDPGTGFPVSHFLDRVRFFYLPSEEDDLQGYLPHAYLTPKNEQGQSGWLLFYPLTGEVRVFANGPSFDRMQQDGHVGRIHDDKPLTQAEYDGWLNISNQG